MLFQSDRRWPRSPWLLAGLSLILVILLNPPTARAQQPPSSGANYTGPTDVLDDLVVMRNTVDNMNDVAVVASSAALIVVATRAVTKVLRDTINR